MQHSTSRTPLWRIVLWTTIAALLLFPAIAMQFTDEVMWTASDFLAAAVLLVGAGASFEIVALRTRHTNQRVAIGTAIVAVVGVVWLQGAVGIF